MRRYMLYTQMFTIKNSPARPQNHVKCLESCSWSTELKSANEERLAKCFRFQPDMRWKSYADLSQLASDHKPVPDPGSHFPQSNLVNQGLKKKKKKKQTALLLRDVKNKPKRF